MISAKISQKKIMLLLIGVLSFLLLACEDKIMSDIQEIVKHSSVVTNYPEEVQKEIEAIKGRDTKAEFQVIGIMVMETDNGMESMKNLFNHFNKNREFKSMRLIKDVKVSNQSAFKHYLILIKGISTAQIASSTADENGVFVISERMPLFPPDGNIQVFIRENLRYPEKEKSRGMSGTSYVQFIVNEDGSLSDFNLKLGFNAACDQEAIRVMKSSPLWIPGNQNGQPVKVRVTVPVRFIL